MGALASPFVFCLGVANLAIWVFVMGGLTYHLGFADCHWGFACGGALSLSHGLESLMPRNNAAPYWCSARQVWLLGFACGGVSRVMCGLLMGRGLTLPFEFWLGGVNAALWVVLLRVLTLPKQTP